MTELYHYDGAFVPLDLTSYDLFWACSIGFDSVWHFLVFLSNVFPRTLFESTHDSSSISESWIKPTHGSRGFQGNWLRINSRLQRTPQVLIDIDSWLKRLSRGLTQNQLTTQADPHVLIQIDPWLKRNTFDSESTHDSTLSSTHVCLWCAAIITVLFL